MMADDRLERYLWDGTGEPDEELRALELLLGRYRLEHRAVVLDIAAETAQEADDVDGSR